MDRGKRDNDGHVSEGTWALTQNTALVEVPPEGRQVQSPSPGARQPTPNRAGSNWGEDLGCGWGWEWDREWGTTYSFLPRTGEDGTGRESWTWDGQPPRPWGLSSYCVAEGRCFCFRFRLSPHAQIPPPGLGLLGVNNWALFASRAASAYPPHQKLPFSHPFPRLLSTQTLAVCAEPADENQKRVSVACGFLGSLAPWLRSWN